MSPVNVRVTTLALEVVKFDRDLNLVYYIFVSVKGLSFLMASLSQWNYGLPQYIYVYICKCIYIHIYIYIYTHIDVFLVLVPYMYTQIDFLLTVSRDPGRKVRHLRKTAQS